MYSSTPRFEQDRHVEAVVQPNVNLGDHDVPEPIESWSLSDFADIVPGGLS